MLCESKFEIFELCFISVRIELLNFLAWPYCGENQFFEFSSFALLRCKLSVKFFRAWPYCSANKIGLIDVHQCRNFIHHIKRNLKDSLLDRVVWIIHHYSIYFILLSMILSIVSSSFEGRLTLTFSKRISSLMREAWNLGKIHFCQRSWLKMLNRLFGVGQVRYANWLYMTAIAKFYSHFCQVEKFYRKQAR